jgi:hypothetical protein
MNLLPIGRGDYFIPFPESSFASLAALAPAIRPKEIVSEIEFPRRRLAPWTPPVISPAAKKPENGMPPLLMNWGIQP